MKLSLLAYPAIAAVCLTAVSAPSPQDPKARLQHALKDTGLVGKWIYDDVSAGFAEAGKSGKPLLVVFR